ncbi:MAG TPA: VTT domain-containing protein [Anaerolineae bacterium]|nr:VTT domain-containing protein [Anaerolineae bacterium]
MDLPHLIQTVGYVGLFAIIFAESGLFFGFFLPGDSLLLTAGLLASRIDPATGQPILNLFILLPLLAVAAILGDNVGYWFGAKAGPRLFNRENSRLFKKKNLLAAKAFYDKHGGKTIVLARFMPFIRTFAPIVAGAVEMEYRRFAFFNFFGGLLWALGVTLVGFFIGRFFGATVDPETLDKYFLILVFVVIFVSALPAMIHIWRDNREEILRRLRRQPVAPPSVEPAED